VKAPSLLIMGEKDYVLKFPGMEEYIRGGAVKHFVPDLDIKYLAILSMPEQGMSSSSPSSTNKPSEEAGGAIIQF
jgi:hypothetical protein